MSFRLAHLAVIAGLMFAAPAAWAERLAVMIVNDQYQNYRNVSGLNRVPDLSWDFRQAGFETVILRNMTSADLRNGFTDIAKRMAEAEKVVVVLAGRFNRVGDQTYLMTSDTRDVSIANVGAYGVALSGLYYTVQLAAGDAIVIAIEAADPQSMGWRLIGDFSPGDVPNGVSVLAGGAGDMTPVIRSLLRPGKSLADVRQEKPNAVRFWGYAPRGRAFIEAGPTPPPAPNPGIGDIQAWQQAANANTIASYRQYLSIFPNGRYAAQARASIDNLQSPEQRARLDEEALNLNRDRRAKIQQYLTVLGFDTKGVDGVFGPNTRNAVSAYQGSLGAPRTGYLTANQVARIEQDGAQRVAEMQREAERQKAERERRDRDYWSVTGAPGTEQGYLAYLERYPNGIYSDTAKDALKEIERQNRRAARREERLAWDDAVIAGTVASYQAYLDDYPDGRFAAEARARIENLRGPDMSEAERQQARAAENALGLDPFRRRLIEVQLQRLGFNTGPADGEFTNQTRNAIAQFQQQSGLPVTGYVSNELQVLLLVSAL